jgi:hypothetical protein
MAALDTVLLGSRKARDAPGCSNKQMCANATSSKNTQVHFDRAEITNQHNLNLQYTSH